VGKVKWLKYDENSEIKARYMAQSGTSNRRKWAILAFAACGALGAAFVMKPERFPGGVELVQHLRGKSTIDDRVAEFGPAVRTRWEPFFKQAGIAYPPQSLRLVGLKAEKRLDVYATGLESAQSLESSGSTQSTGRKSRERFIRSLPIFAASGTDGPKLRQGDMQVPEGVYRIESLNPNSAFHLALRVNYPNAADRAQADIENRTNLGGDIMIHGSNASVGCLAMGDEVAEDLFVLAAETGYEKIDLLLCPLDFRTSPMPSDKARPAWVQARYTELAAALKTLPRSEPAP
jgi:hypothetical protein